MIDFNKINEKSKRAIAKIEKYSMEQRISCIHAAYARAAELSDRPNVEYAHITPWLDDYESGAPYISVVYKLKNRDTCSSELFYITLY